VILLSKILIIVSALGLLRCSEKFRTSSREFDELAIAALKRLAHVAEDQGYPAQMGPFAVIVMTLCFMYSLYLVQAGLH